jgi:hypothetical protein
MNLKDAKLCIECDEIFVGDTCPRCGASVGWQWIHKWLEPIGKPKPWQTMADPFAYDTLIVKCTNERNWLLRA